MMSGALKRMSSERRMSADVQRATVFLDSNVLTQFVEGKLNWLFSPAALRKFSYAINPIVLQELLLLSNSAQHHDRLEAVRKQTEVLPIDGEKAESLLQRARKLRN